MRIIIIGGSGFIGRHVVAGLHSRGHEITSVQRRVSPELPEEVCQVTCEQQVLESIASDLRDWNAEIVIDMVSSSASQARSTTGVFAGYTGRLIAISSQDVYKAFGIVLGTEAGPPEPGPIREESPLRTRRETYPPDLLERLKRLLGWVNDDYSNPEMEAVVMNTPSLPFTVLRLPMIYGPGDYLHRLYPLLRRIEDGRTVIPFADTVAAWHSPRGYVENVAAAIILAAENASAAGRVFNVAEEQSFTELEWAAKVCAAAGWQGSLATIPFAEAPAHLQLPGNYAQQAIVSSERIRRELGYREPTAPEVALARTIEWERANPPDPIPEFDYAAEDEALAARGGRPAAFGAQS